MIEENPICFFANYPPLWSFQRPYSSTDSITLRPVVSSLREVELRQTAIDSGDCPNQYVSVTQPGTDKA